MQVEELVQIIQGEKNCTAVEAEQVVSLLGVSNNDATIASDDLKKSALDLWETQFGQNSRNFGLTRAEFHALVTRLQSGDQELFERVFLHHFKSCMNFLMYRKSIPQPIAYDASMDTLIAFRKMLVEGKIDYGNLRYLFTRMAVFAAQKISIKASKIITYDHIEHQKTTENEDIDEESIEILQKAWKKLGEECQSLLQRFYYNNQSWKEIADMLQITEGNARKKGQRCREALSVGVKKLI